MKKTLLFLTVLSSVLSGCDSTPAIMIDRDSVKIVQGKYTGETLDLTFHADLTGTVDTERVYWEHGDGRFHRDSFPQDGVTLSYEVFNPFGDLDLKTLNDRVGDSKTVTFPLPVFGTDDNPYDYTLRITLYINARKIDSYSAKFHLNEPK